MEVMIESLLVTQKGYWRCHRRVCANGCAVSGVAGSLVIVQASSSWICIERLLDVFLCRRVTLLRSSSSELVSLKNGSGKPNVLELQGSAAGVIDDVNRSSA
jgi:hypothetical protein